MVRVMAAFPCPYCGQAVAASSDDEPSERCPSCDGGLLIAYRYRIVAARGEISGGALYEAVHDGFGDKVAVVFGPTDDAAVAERFVEGYRLFSELSGRGLVKIHDLSSRGDRRPYVVMSWIAGGTLETRVTRRGPIPQVTMFGLVKDLLAGLARAHRSMPAIVHGHIHPGKIGFLDEDEVVLFGFEWARQVFEQDSNLADSFVAQAEAEQESGRANDLRMLGQALVYATTGEWIAGKSAAEQRALTRAQVPGPLGVALDRMLGAGDDGYKSAIDAVVDLDSLLRGSSRWKTSTKKDRDYSQDLISKAWSADDAASDSLEDYEEVEEIEDFDDYAPDPGAPAQSSWTPEPVASASPALRQPYVNAAAPATPPKPGKVIALVFGSMIMFGTCLVGLAVEDEDHEAEKQVVRRRGAPPVSEPVSIPEPLPIPEPLSPQLRALHHYTGTITGPEDFAGREIGEPCDVWIEPKDGGLNCRWYIDCGEPRQRIYGGGTAGYSTCEVEDGHPTTAQDEEDDAPDGAFMAALTGAEPMVLVQDRWLLPPTRALISIEDGGVHPGPIPAVELAPRLDGEAIQAAIDRGELPSFGPPEQLSNDQLLAVLDTSLAQLHGCGVESGTTLTITIDIQRAGRVRRVAIEPTQEAEIERCISRAIRRLRFSEFTGEPMSINWNVSW